MPSVIETSNGDFLGIWRKIILTYSYDHRIINGAVEYLLSMFKYPEN